MKAKEYLLYIGTYTEESSQGIYGLAFSPESGEMKELGLMVRADNPSFLITDSKENVLYAVHETDTWQGKYGGSVGSYQIDKSTGKLTGISCQPVHGKSPCHLCINASGTRLITANYSDGSLSVFSLSENGEIHSMNQRISHEGSGLNEERQEGPHMHFAAYTPDETSLYAVDLGIDQIKVYHFNKEEACLYAQPGQTIYIEGGSGPRHLCFHPNGVYFYLVSELTSKVMVYRRLQNDSAELLQTIDTLPDNAEKADNLCSAIRITSDGRFLYVANRGHDSITAYGIDKESCELQLINYTPAGGEFPRDIEIDPDDTWLFAANQKSDEITAFKIQKETGVLRPMGTIAKISRPVCIHILNRQ